ncbi:pyridine nucleotide-disulfide oxidoreductase family protein [Tanacetum coccineum]
MYGRDPALSTVLPTTRSAIARTGGPLSFRLQQVYTGLKEHKHGHSFGLGSLFVLVVLGNVALDVARILLRPPIELATTDIATHALDKRVES